MNLLELFQLAYENDTDVYDEEYFREYALNAFNISLKQFELKIMIDLVELETESNKLKRSLTEIPLP